MGKDHLNFGHQGKRVAKLNMAWKRSLLPGRCLRWLVYFFYLRLSGYCCSRPMAFTVLGSWDRTLKATHRLWWVASCRSSLRRS